MTIRHLHIFLEVYREMNITRAAEKLHMTQPAVTRAIKELESYYGVRLFERMNRRIYVTGSGEKLYHYALHIDDTFDAMEKMLRNWDSAGVLRVGASITVGNCILPGLIKRFRELQPDTQVHVEIRNSDQLQQFLMENRLDIGFMEGTAAHAELVCRRFSEDGMALIVPPGHELLSRGNVELQELTEYDMLLREPGSSVRTYLDDIFAIRGITLEPLWQSVSTQAIVRAVAAGLGISVLPRRLVEGDVESGAVCTCEIADEELSLRLFAVWHKNKYLSASAQRFIELCESMYGSAVTPI